MDRIETILLGICTYRRQELLSCCLASVDSLSVPNGYILKVVVVDNECSSKTQKIVKNAKLQNLYLEEPRRGISFVRNRIIDAAIEHAADFIAFVDDDQIVPATWLENMILSKEKMEADVVRGGVRYMHQNGSIVTEAFSKWQVCNESHSTGTGGVLFSKWLISSNGLNLRFDHRFALSGGEDRFFFLNAYLKGAKIIRTPIAVVDEVLHGPRPGILSNFKRHFNQAWVDTMQDGELFGNRVAKEIFLKKYAGSFFKGILSLAIAPFVMPFSHSYGKKKFLKAARLTGRSLGATWGLCAKSLPQPYA